MKCFYFLLHLISVQSVWRKIWIWKYLFKTGGKRLRTNAWLELLGMIFWRCVRSKEIDLVLSLNNKMFIYVWCIWHLIRKWYHIYLYITKGVYSRIRLKEGDMNNQYKSDLAHSPIVLVTFPFIIDSMY